MSYDITNTRAALKTLLATSTKVANVYDTRQTNIAGYPAIIFDLTDTNNVMLDNVTNVRTHTFTIWIVQEVTVETENQAKTLLDDATTEVIGILEKVGNQTLSGNIDWMLPATGSRKEVATPEGNVIYQEIVLKCNIGASIL